MTLSSSKKKKKYNSIYMLMVGENNPDSVLCIKQLKQDRSDIFMELPTVVPGWTGSPALQVHLIISISVRVK